jgi:hypothetical protein
MRTQLNQAAVAEMTRSTRMRWAVDSFADNRKQLAQALGSAATHLKPM